jgi:putative ABC transport system substrate-binding protein
MRRREFITLLGGAVTWPLAARAQQPAMPVIGILNSGSPDQFEYLVRAVRQGLSESGYVDGRNIAIASLWAAGQNDRLPALAADLVRRQVSVIVATTTPSVLAAKAATTTIPIIFYTAADPVGAGLVGSLNRPGGNLTGVTSLNVELGPKKLELLHELLPTATAFALLTNPTNPVIEETLSRDLQEAARGLGLQLRTLHASTERELDTVIATSAQPGGGGLVIGTDSFFTTHSEQLAALTLRHAVPTIFQYREFAAAGGLMSYAGSNTDAYRLVGVYASRILKGEKPADLPVQQSTKVELIINLKTAKALGITVPLALLTRADEVIE